MALRGRISVSSDLGKGRATYNRGKPHINPIQKTTLPIVLFLLTAGILPINIIGTCAICIKKRYILSRNLVS